jgi:hypothetical protein
MDPKKLPDPVAGGGQAFRKQVGPAESLSRIHVRDGRDEKSLARAAKAARVRLSEPTKLPLVSRLRSRRYATRLPAVKQIIGAFVARSSPRATFLPVTPFAP